MISNLNNQTVPDINGLRLPDSLPCCESDLTSGVLMQRLLIAFDPVCRNSKHIPAISYVEINQINNLIKNFSYSLSSIRINEHPESEMRVLARLARLPLVYPALSNQYQMMKELIADHLMRSEANVLALLKCAWNPEYSWPSLPILQDIIISVSEHEQHLPLIEGMVMKSLQDCESYLDDAPLGSVIANFALAGLVFEALSEEVQFALSRSALRLLFSAETSGIKLDPYSRPREFELVCRTLAHTLIIVSNFQREGSTTFTVPSFSQASDLTRSWLENGDNPISNFINNYAELLKPHQNQRLSLLYKMKGIRNFRRFSPSDKTELADSELLSDPKVLDRKRTDPKFVILCAFCVADSNGAFADLYDELVNLKNIAKENGWGFDLVEVISREELASHLSRYMGGDSKVVLHTFGHGDSDGFDFGNIRGSRRASFTREMLYGREPDDCFIECLQSCVDTWIFHSCSSASLGKSGRKRQNSIAYATYRACKGKINVMGFADEDCFDGLKHRPTSGGARKPIFISRPVYGGSRYFPRGANLKD